MGIDVSKDELMGCYQRDGAWQKYKILNSCEAIDAWLGDFGGLPMHFVLEHTGTYSDRLIYCLGQKGLKFSVVNPSQSRAMSKLLQKTNKTDDQDARTLSMMGEKMDLQPYKQMDETREKRKEAFSALAGLQKQEQMLKNQLHALAQKVSPNALVVNSLQSVLDSVSASMASLEKELKPNGDEERDRQLVARIQTIPGIGSKTALSMVALFGDFSQFSSAKAFAKFIGICPSEFLSGKSVRGKTKITRLGSGKIRALLFNCARSAIKNNPKIKEHYQKLVQKGKNGKSALTAQMHKLARLVFGVARSGQDYDPKFALLKQKN